MAAFVNNITSSARTGANAVVGRASETLDYRFPPQRRQEVRDQTQDYAERNPKTAGLLALLLILTVPPFLFFLAFTSTVLIGSLAFCLSVAIMVAITFTALCFGGALLLLLPALAIGSIVALGVWTWTLAAIWVGGRLGVFSPELTKYTLGSGQTPGDARDAINTELEKYKSSPPSQDNGPSPSTLLSQFEKNPNVVYLREQAQRARNKYGGAPQTEANSSPIPDTGRDDEAIGIQNDVRPMVEGAVAS